MSTVARAFALVVFLVLMAAAGLVGFAVHRVNRVFDVPPSPITRATSPDEMARGGRLFRTLCLDCHAGPGGTRPTGARVTSAPSFIGEVWAPNITADRQNGVGAWTDGELARLLRNGIRRDHYYAATMPRFGHLADEDVAAIIGFMRSSDPSMAATPAAAPVPQSKMAVGGVMALAYAAGMDASGDAHLASPPRGPTADYGRYLASYVYACVDCHTSGLGAASEKLKGPGALTGGVALHQQNGATVYSRNLTPDGETGLGSWSADDLTRALQTGTAKDGHKLRPPMPIFHDMDATEAAALYAFLRSLPATRSPTPRTDAGAPDR